MICVYDFDKTLTENDTLLGFFLYGLKKSNINYLKVLIYFCVMIAARFKLISNFTLKNIGIKLFLKNLNAKERNEKFESYHKKIRFNSLFKNTNFSNLSNIYIVSGSFEEYLRPIFPQNVIVIGSIIAEDYKTLLFNCYEGDKIKALKNKGVYQIDVLYTDSISDVAMAKIAKKICYVKKDKILECNSYEIFLQEVCK